MSAEASERLSLSRIQVRGHRNLRSVDLEFSPFLNVISGDNGQGKTNLLEAIYLLCTSKSFRTSQMSDLTPVVANDEAREGMPQSEVLGEPVATSVRGSFLEGNLPREQSLGLGGGRRIARIDGKRPRALSEYARQSPVVVFYPGELTLTMGPSRERRKLLDRVGFFLHATYASELEAYGEALRSRQKVLELRGVHARDLDHWEALCAAHGRKLCAYRNDVARGIGRVTLETFARVAAPDLRLTMGYRSSAPEDDEAYRKALANDRERDRRRGAAHTGPHRDDLELRISGADVRLTASQGQHRALVLSLKAAELETIREARGVSPLLLLDDVSSELDADRTQSYFRFLASRDNQVFLTTTRSELIPHELAAEAGASSARLGGLSRADFSAKKGLIEPMGSGPATGV